MPKAKKAKTETEDSINLTEEHCCAQNDDLNNMKHFHFRSKEFPLIGAHVSAGQGVQNSILNAVKIGSNSAAMFLKNQRTWNFKPLSNENIKLFKEFSEKFKFDSFMPHGSYLINLGNPDQEKRLKSFNSFVDDLSRCNQLDIKLYNFHPGSTVGECSISESIKFISDCINKAIDLVPNVCVVLENMAGQGNVIGSKFIELKQIIDLIKDKSRIGVCLDTCHLFAAGYDIRTRKSFDKTMKEFEEIIGFEYLKGMHLNDSKGALGSCLDRHENIGKGLIGLECFKMIVNDSRFCGIPLILETPIVNEDYSIYTREIELLYSLLDQKQ